MESPEEEEEEDRAPDRAAAAVVSRTVIFDSPPVQESPFSNYLNNLSPIKPAKAANMTQAFPGINSSPLVFASPTIKLQPGTDHLKRNEMFGSPKEEHSHSVRKDDLPDSSQKSKELVNLSGIASDCVNESSDCKDMLRVQSCSSSRIADGFLADPFEADCANSTHLSGQHGNCSRSNSEFHCQGDSTNGFGREDTDVQLVSPEQNNIDAEKLFTCDGPTVEAEEYHGTEPSFSVICDVAMGDLSVDDSENQVGIGPVSDNKEGCHLGASSSHVQPLYDPLQDSEANENHDQDASESLRLLDDTHHREVMQQQRFLLRRCLRFDDTLLDVSSNSPVPLSYNVTSPDSLAMGELEKGDPSVVTSTYIKTSASTVKAVITGCNGKSSAMTTNKPSGIGLHLNSIIGARSINSRETIRKKHDKDNQGGRDLNSASARTSNMLDKPTDFPFSVESHNFSKVQELYGTPLDKRTLPLGFADAEFTQTNAKRRRKASNTSDSDICKRCSCKKSRCLKLYCDCFAAGLFCTEPCACQGCLNRFEEQDTVLAARELIESRNPLAFAPKIVHTNKRFDASNGEDGIWSTPSSARHKKGCNCKRSICQKKYCECYQANVGCSDNCRCEGCRNVFGTKEDFLVARKLERSIVDEASLEGMSVVKPAMVATYSRDHLMPPTPSFQFSDNRKGLQRSRHVIECLSPSSSVKSGAAGWSREMQSEGNKESPTLVTITDFTDPDCSEKVDEFSPKHDSLGSSSHLPSLLGGGRPPSRFLWQWGSLEAPGIVSGGENSHQDDKPCSKVYETLDDDGPGVSKDVHSPTKPVIISSPSRKRVSSPHKQVHESRLTSSTALRSSGKFILKAVPSFPLLIPCTKPRDNINLQETRVRFISDQIQQQERPRMSTSVLMSMQTEELEG